MNIKSMRIPGLIQPVKSMNQHIYIDKGNPIISLEVETLSDGSEAFNVHLRTAELNFTSEKNARDAMEVFAAILAKGTIHSILHL